MGVGHVAPVAARLIAAASPIVPDEPLMAARRRADAPGSGIASTRRSRAAANLLQLDLHHRPDLRRTALRNHQVAARDLVLALHHLPDLPRGIGRSPSPADQLAKVAASGSNTPSFAIWVDAPQRQHIGLFSARARSPRPATPGSGPGRTARHWSAPCPCVRLGAGRFACCGNQREMRGFGRRHQAPAGVSCVPSPSGTALETGAMASRGPAPWHWLRITLLVRDVDHGPPASAFWSPEIDLAAAVARRPDGAAVTC